MDKSKTEKIVYFVRHGQSEANLPSSSIFQPPESPLTELGRKQAERIAQRVSRLHFEVLISSPFARAKETTEKISEKTGIKPEFSDLFVERIRPTRAVGKSKNSPEISQLWSAWEDSLYAPGAKIEDGENFNEIITRADMALDFLKNKAAREIVVVTHGFFLRTIIARVILGEFLTSAAFKNFQTRVPSIENTGLSVLTYGVTAGGPAWHLWIYNDHAHLAD